MLAQFSMFPVGSRESLSKDIAKILDIVDRSGLSYRFTAMATIVEGDWEAVMALIRKCRNAMRKNNRRVYISITIDDRKEARHRLTGKTEAVEKILNRKLMT